MEEETIISADLRGKSLETITPDDIPPKARDIFLSNNKIAKLPNDIFFTKCRIWNIYLDYNVLSDLKFITCFQYLGTLDIRHNSLEIDDILDLRRIDILHLYLQDNNFQKYTNSGPLTIPALLKKAWIIDGYFITDHIRRKAKEFKKTKQFGEIILSARRHPLPFHCQESISNAAKSFLGGSECRFVDPSRFLNSTGIAIQFLTGKPQIDRLTYLKTQSSYKLPEGDFFDLFGIALGILSNHWCGFPIQLIPRVISRAYWSLISETFEKIENWVEFVILSQIDACISPRNDKENDVWSRINLRKYLQQGSIPQLGSFPRLLISAIIYRSEELDEKILKSEDMMIYVKFRNSYDFGPIDKDFDVIYNEMFMELPCEMTVIPHLNDSVSIRHPFTNNWVSCDVIELINGRAILKIDNRFIQPIWIESLYWDGRGLFREKQKIEDPIQKPKQKEEIIDDDLLFDKPSQKVSKRKTFLTITDSVLDTESTKQDAEKFSIPLPPCAIPPKNIIPREDPSYFLRTSQSMLSNKSINKINDNNYNITKTRNINVNLNEPKLVKMKLKKKKTEKKVFSHSTLSHPLKTTKTMPTSFRGIVDPNPTRPKKSFIVGAAPAKKPTQVVDSVINITLGAEISNSRRIRIFHVRVVNTITKKFSYVKVKEDEISEEDASRLVDLYRQHIESKMIIIPGE